MSNIASVLKSEISRIARREARQMLASTQKRLASTRKDLSASRQERNELARRVAKLEQLVRSANVAAPAPLPEDHQVRFSAKGLTTHRRRLGLSAAEFGVLVGASAQSVYNWENGKAKPRAAQLSRIAAVRSLGKREARVRLEALE